MKTAAVTGGPVASDQGDGFGSESPISTCSCVACREAREDEARKLDTIAGDPPAAEPFEPKQVEEQDLTDEEIEQVVVAEALAIDFFKLAIEARTLPETLISAVMCAAVEIVRAGLVDYEDFGRAIRLEIDAQDAAAVPVQLALRDPKTGRWVRG